MNSSADDGSAEGSSPRMPKHNDDSHLVALKRDILTVNAWPTCANIHISVLATLSDLQIIFGVHFRDTTNVLRIYDHIMEVTYSERLCREHNRIVERGDSPG